MCIGHGTVVLQEPNQQKITEAQCTKMYLVEPPPAAYHYLHLFLIVVVVACMLLFLS